MACEVRIEGALELDESMLIKLLRLPTGLSMGGPFILNFYGAKALCVSGGRLWLRLMSRLVDSWGGCSTLACMFGCSMTY